MPRHLDNLKRLLKKLQLRYGSDDAIAQQVKQAVESREVMESQPPHWLTAHGERRSGKVAHAHLNERSGA